MTTTDAKRRPEAMSIGQVAQRTGLSVHALRWFERQGLYLRPIPRAGQRRMFDSSDVAWLMLCNRLRASGMPIAEIRRFAALVQAGAGNEAERLAVLEAHEQEVRKRIAELEKCLEIIQDKVGVYRRHLAAGSADRLWSPPFADNAPT